VLATLFVGLTIVLLRTENSFGGADHFSHFYIAHWAWTYPDLLFHHWGKPVFTILVSPFAQLGIDGARFYNLCVGLLTACLAWRIALHMQLSHAWVVIILVVFTPIYFVSMFTSLTEVTFSCFIVLAILLFLKQRYLWASVVASLLPIIRNEGIVVLPLFVAAFLLAGRGRAVPLLATGFAVISIAGWPFKDSLGWLITEMPDAGEMRDVYGSGELLHFVTSLPNVLGPTTGLLCLVGGIVLVGRWVTRERGRLGDTFYFILLVVGSFVTFVGAHSVAWWQGIGLGLIRVTAAVAPLAALTAAVGVSRLVDIERRGWSLVVGPVVALLVAKGSYDATQVYRSGFRLDPQTTLMNEAVDYVVESGLGVNRIHYYVGYVGMRLGLDPRDERRGRLLHRRKRQEVGRMPDGSLIVWDAHFGPNEGRTPLESLLKHPELRVVKRFRPEQPVTVLGGHDYEIVIFQKKS